MSTPHEYDPQNTPQPSAEALALAVKLSGHTHCQRGIARNIPGETPCCDGCLGDAATIDAALHLPARNAALMLAQGVIDIYFAGRDPQQSHMDELREALSRIKV